ncbi:hypothetical protein [Mucilaginibacter kameinonensis]|uniref:hypothetical protein n=1 Tax=Mucilaginibacter kameinonensis TaxID=452286 RepID=UPI000EF7F87A|nr:hypothetical protein [Mucilaginibacter kameinonensis]
MPGPKGLKKPLFYFEPLSTWDLVTVWGYGVITVIFIFYNFCDVGPNKVVSLIFYTVPLQLFNYFLNYVSLRNLKTFLIWCGFGAVHICLFFLLKNNTVYNGARGVLLNTTILLFLYQGLRITSRKIQGQELGMPTNQYKDLFDNRDITVWDFIFFAIYFGSFGYLSVFAMSKV